ncbi:LysM peptidoglycan-binding domain-containing protein [Bacillus sp. WMMC1349]|uniref:C40 family peptidase n=1 Tax=Bacillus sp. WMMC1349 TaxID=2736254 RepID=UPI0015564528|nr:peptidoglycan endopeptidase [Bacillus sp. WMMC1349]NPC92007.1 LysM peptidoglycan-binding domain-containing protein [Bacillus sp. WMMC1349]
MKKQIFTAASAVVLGSTLFAGAASAANVQVQSGDTLWGLSQKYGTTVTQIKQENQLTSDMIYVGQTLSINGSSSTTQSTTSTTYKVVSGDSLWKIANTHNMTVNELKSLNSLTSDIIYVGQVLKVKGTTSTSPNTTSPTGSSSSDSTTYKVISGDSLSKIAKSYNMTVEELKSLNGLTSDIIYVGQVLKVKGTTSTSPNTTSPTGGQTSSKLDTTKLVSDAKALIGTPYVWGGTTTAGFDCSGFIWYILNKQTDVARTNTAGYWSSMTSVSSPAVGDFVFFTTYQPGPSHMGVYIGNNKFIHAGSKGVTTSDLTTSYWKERYLGAKRF